MKFKRIGNHLGYHLDENGRRYGPYYVTASVRIDGQQKNTKRSLETEDFQTAKTKGPAAYAALIAELKGKPVHKGGLVTVGDAVARLRSMEWSLKKRSRDAKPRTLEFYDQRARALLDSWPGLETTPLAKLTEMSCREWAERFDKEFAAQTYNNTLLVLRYIVEIGIKEGLIHPNKNPLAQVTRTRVAVEPTVLPTAEQWEKIKSFLKCRVHRTARDTEFLILLTVMSGVRHQEAMGLEWRDVDWQGGYLNIERQRNPDGTTQTTKTGKPRKFPLHPELRALLLAEFNRRGRPSPDSRITLADDCRKALSRACEFAGCRVLNHQDLRKMTDTRLAQLRVDHVLHAAWMGHGYDVAMKIYAQVVKDHEQAVAAGLTFSTKPAKEPENVVELKQAKG